MKSEKNQKSLKNLKLVTVNPLLNGGNIRNVSYSRCENKCIKVDVSSSKVHHG